LKARKHQHIRFSFSRFPTFGVPRLAEKGWLNKANAKIPPGKEDFQSNENLSMPDAT
jgi:hypothetical protein